MKEKEILELIQEYGHIAVVKTELEDVELNPEEKEQVIETTTGQFLDYLSVGDIVIITKSIGVFDHTAKTEHFNAADAFLWHMDHSGHFVTPQFAHFLLVEKHEGFEVVTNVDCNEHIIVFKVKSMGFWRYFILERVRFAVVELFGVTLQTKKLKIEL